MGFCGGFFALGFYQNAWQIIFKKNCIPRTADVCLMDFCKESMHVYCFHGILLFLNFSEILNCESITHTVHTVHVYV